MKLGAGVRLAGAEDLGDLGVGEAGEELEGDQLALARLEPLQRRRDREASLAVLGALGEAEAFRISGLGGQLGLTTAAPQLVESGVAGDSEKPRPRLAALRVEAVALAEGTLEDGGGDFIGRSRVAQQAGDVGLDVVAAGAVEPLEGQIPRPGRVFRFSNKRLLHARTTAGIGIHHAEYRTIGEFASL